MIKFFYTILKYCLLLLFSVTLLTLACWNIPQTRGGVVKVKELVEERYDIDIDKSVMDFMKYYNKFRGVKRDECE